MLGRMGMGVLPLAAIVLMAAVLVGGCGSAQQRQERKQMQQEKKMAAAEAKRQKEVAAMEAKQQKLDAAAAEKREKEEAKRMAEADRKQRELDRKQAEKEQREALAEEKENREGIGSDMIRDERKVRSVDRFVMAQAAAGAREDAMLNDEHFEGAELNALGRGKLNLIARAVPSGSTATTIIYVNSTDTKLNESRGAAMTSFWKDSQYADLKFEVKNGVNDNLTAPAKPNLDALKKMREEQSTSQGGVMSSPSAAPSGTPTPTR